MKHKPVPPVSPCVMDPGASGPPVDAKGDSLPIKPMERPGMRHTGALGAMAVPKVARPASARPDPHRPARQSMVMSRPMPVVKIIAKLCFPRDLLDANQPSSDARNSKEAKENNDPFVYEFVRVRIPAYATVTLVKESVIKLEPKFFSLEPRQLAMSILSSIVTTEDQTIHESNLDPSFDRKLLIECHETIRYQYEHDMPVLLVFWIASMPAPLLQLDMPSISMEEDKPEPKVPVVLPDPLPQSPPKDKTSPRREAFDFSDIAVPMILGGAGPGSKVATIEIDGVLVHDLLDEADGEEVEDEEEITIVSNVRRTVLVESTTLNAALMGESPDEIAEKPQEVEKPAPIIKTVVAPRSDQRLSGYVHDLVASGMVRESMKASTQRAMMSSRVTISDVLLEEQLWLRPNVLKEGWLTKQLKKSGKKEQRWFQLRLDHHLYYFKDVSDSVPLGRIPLAISTLELPLNTPKITSFELYYTMRGKERRLILADEDEPALLSWLNVLHRTMADAKDTYAASIVQEGYLQKKGVGLKSWNRRYFVLKDGCLFYYMTANDAKLAPEQPRGKISLEDCYVTANNSTQGILASSSSSLGSSTSSLTSSSIPSSSSTINVGQMTSNTANVMTNHVFRIHVSNETQLFMASSASELQQWITAIVDERDSLKEQAHLRDKPSSSNVLPISDSKMGPTWSLYAWSLLPIHKRLLPTVDRDLPIDETIAEQIIDLNKISAHLDSPQLRLIRHHHARIRTKIIRQKARLGIYDVLLAPLTRILPSVALPDVINLRCHFGESSVSLKCPIYASILEGTALAVDLLIRRKIFPPHVKPADFVVKLCGSRQYILDVDTPFSEVVYVREQLGRGRPFVEIMLHTRVAVIEEISSAKFASTLFDQQFGSLVDAESQLQASQSNTTPSLASTDSHVPEDDLDALLVQLTGSKKEDQPSTPKENQPSATLNSTSEIDRNMPEKILRRMQSTVEEDCYEVSEVRGHSFAIRVISLKNFSYTILDAVVPQETVDNSKPEARISFFVQASLFHGNRVIGEQVRTAKRLTPYFNQLLDFQVDCSQLAPEMRIGITLYVNHASKDLPLAWINIPITDYIGRIRNGSYETGMWIQPKKAHPVGSCESDSARSLMLCLEFEKTPLPLVFLDFIPVPELYEVEAIKRENSERPRHYFGPYKSEISTFLKATPSKAAHPILGEESMFGLGTFNRIQEVAKQPSIGSSRLNRVGATSPGSSAPGSVSPLHARATSNSSIILGAKRSPQNSTSSENSIGKSGSTSNDTMSEAKPIDIQGSSHLLGSTSPEPSRSPASSASQSSPPSSVELHDSNSAISSQSHTSTTAQGIPIVRQPGSPPASGDIQGFGLDPLGRLGIPSSLPARSRKSYLVSASPPAPLALGEAMHGRSKFSAALSTSPTSPSATNKSPAQAQSGLPASPPPPSAITPEVTSAPIAISSGLSTSTALSSSDTAPMSVSPHSPPDSAKSPLYNTMWSKTVARSNLANFAQKVSPNLSSDRLVAHLQEIDRICKLDPLTPLTDTQKQLLWAYRKHLIEKPESFPKLFLAPNLLNPAHRLELHRMLKTAPLMPPEMALQLLDHKFPDAHVRAYAVRCLVAFGDEELASYLLQLVQVLQYESLYLAPLASFLVQRAILNPMLIGMGLLWHLQAELYRPETEIKFGLLMEAILLGLKPSLRTEFVTQIEFVAKLVELNDQLSTIPPSSRTGFLRKALASYVTATPTTSQKPLFEGQPSKVPSSPLLSGLSNHSITSGSSASSATSSTPSLAIPTPTSDEIGQTKNATSAGTLSSTPISLGSSPSANSANSAPMLGQLDAGATAWSSGTIDRNASVTPSPLHGLPPLPPPSPTRLVLPLSSSMVVKGIVVEKCKVMDSAAFPLWLTFENEDPFAEPISVLFKFGDDLRQDALTLQMFTIMDRLWKREGLDLKMSLYKCLPTGPNMGMIEVVPNAETTARIQKEAGGIMGAFKQTPLFNWLKTYNAEPALLDDAIQNFTRSCAAYCVATYVIGVGDRHNDNIMVTKAGKLFHIDFAHFLGNIIKFGVYKRERAPFVLTPEFAYVMGGEKSAGFAQFKALACNIYNILRRHSSTFISLFELMLFTGLAQLTSYDDLAYLKKSLLTGVSSESDAYDTFGKLVEESLSTKSTQLNFAIHIFAHPD